MKHPHRIIISHKKFKDLKSHTFYFSDTDNLIKALKIISGNNFKIKYSLDYSVLNVDKLKDIVFYNDNIIDKDEISNLTNKKEIIKWINKINEEA